MLSSDNSFVYNIVNSRECWLQHDSSSYCISTVQHTSLYVMLLSFTRLLSTVMSWWMCMCACLGSRVQQTSFVAGRFIWSWVSHRNCYMTTCVADESCQFPLVMLAALTVAKALCLMLSCLVSSYHKCANDSAPFSVFRQLQKKESRFYSNRVA